MLFDKNIKQICRILTVCLVLPLLTACGSGTDEPEQLRDLDFTVVQETELPEQLRTIIIDKKANRLKLTYTNSEALYIAQGYGAQPTGGYSVTVNELWLAENAVFFDSELLGPEEQEQVAQTITYPYVVIKTELI